MTRLEVQPGRLVGQFGFWGIITTDLIDVLCLLYLRLEDLLNPVLHNLPSLLHTTRESGKRLFQLCLHLRCDVLMLLRHRFDLASNGVEGNLQTS